MIHEWQSPAYQEIRCDAEIGAYTDEFGPENERPISPVVAQTSDVGENVDQT